MDFISFNILTALRVSTQYNTWQLSMLHWNAWISSKLETLKHISHWGLVHSLKCSNNIVILILLHTLLSLVCFNKSICNFTNLICSLRSISLKSLQLFSFFQPLFVMIIFNILKYIMNYLILMVFLLKIFSIFLMV